MTMTGSGVRDQESGIRGAALGARGSKIRVVRPPTAERRNEDDSTTDPRQLISDPGPLIPDPYAIRPETLDGFQQ